MNDFTLISGGAMGADDCFNEQAGLMKLNCINFSFLGHKTVSPYTKRILSDEELKTAELMVSSILADRWVRAETREFSVDSYQPGSGENKT